MIQQIIKYINTLSDGNQMVTGAMLQEDILEGLFEMEIVEKRTDQKKKIPI